MCTFDVHDAWSVRRQRPNIHHTLRCRKLHGSLATDAMRIIQTLIFWSATAVFLVSKHVCYHRQSRLFQLKSSNSVWHRNYGHYVRLDTIEIQWHRWDGFPNTSYNNKSKISLVRTIPVIRTIPGVSVIYCGKKAEIHMSVLVLLVRTLSNAESGDRSQSALMIGQRVNH